jgi:hypothetical protein
MNLLEVQRSFRVWLSEESQDAATSLGESAAPGLAVHLNTYRGQLLSCLRETFGAVRAWLGDTAFDAAAASHIEHVPPSSWTLDDYARDFPETLGKLYPADAEVAELACLERSLAAVFTTSDCTPLTPHTIDPLHWAGIDWDHALLRLVPTFAALPMTTNAAAIWSAIKADEQPPAAARLDSPTQLVLWRKGFMPCFRSTDLAEAAALQHVAGGMNFGELCAQQVACSGEADGPRRAAAWLGLWLRDGLIAGIT